MAARSTSTPVQRTSALAGSATRGNSLKASGEATWPRAGVQPAKVGFALPQALAAAAQLAADLGHTGFGAA